MEVILSCRDCRFNIEDVWGTRTCHSGGHSSCIQEGERHLLRILKERGMISEENYKQIEKEIEG
jgi:hypothetical protein